MNAEIRGALDNMAGAVALFAEYEIEVLDAPDVAKTLRQINRALWHQINIVEAMTAIDFDDVVEVVDQEPDGVRTLLEQGVLLVDPKRWWRWTS